MLNEIGSLRLEVRRFRGILVGNMGENVVGVHCPRSKLVVCCNLWMSVCISLLVEYMGGLYLNLLVLRRNGVMKEDVVVGA